MFFYDDEKTDIEWPPAPTMEHITESFSHSDASDEPKAGHGSEGSEKRN